MPRLFERKSLYQSTLVQQGPFVMKRISDVINSKDGDSKIVKIQPLDDEQEYWVKCENEHVAAQFDLLPKDTYVLLEAAGSRDSATIRAEDEDGGPIGLVPFEVVEEEKAPWVKDAQEQVDKIQQRKGWNDSPSEKAAPSWGEPPEAVQKMREQTGDVGRMTQALKDARKICLEVGLDGDENVRAVGISLFIERR